MNSKKIKKIVLFHDQDLGMINQSHPEWKAHTHYKHSAEFPANISNLLLLSADHWWEHLGKL